MFLSSLFDFPKPVVALPWGSKSITKIYTKIEFLNSEIAAIINLVRYDKKNIKGENRFTLLSKIGEANINNSVSVKLMELAFDMYKSS